VIGAGAAGASYIERRRHYIRIIDCRGRGRNEASQMPVDVMAV